MAVGKIKKTTAEVKRVTLDYSRWLGDTEIITTKTFAATPATDTALTVGTSAIAADGKSVTMYIEGGEDDNVYDLLVQVVTSAGQIKEEEVKVTVNDL